ncbi:MAG: hypothetical protein R6V58_12055, partial [Planctomycetota bacterium]
LAIYRMTTPWNVIAGRRGVGRLGGDIWNVIDPGSKVGAGRHGAGSLINRWPVFGTWGQLVVRSAFLAPGENGAIPTTPFEMLREGIQDCEARIFIENALADEGRGARLGDDLAARARAMLDQRAWLLCAGKFPSGFRTRQHVLYRIAAEVADKLAP